MKIFAKIRFYWGAGVIAFVVAVLMIPLVYFFPTKKGVIIHKLNVLILRMIGARLEQVGQRDPEANLFLFNHQGVIDIIAMEAIEHTHMGWVAKKELFEMPIYGKLLSLGKMIAVDRQNKTGLVKLLNDGKALIQEQHRALAIFPEGTRAKDQKLLAFKAGAKFLANKLNLRVQPVVITGSKYLLDEHKHTAHNSTIKITYLPAFNAKESPKEWYEKLKDSMQETIDKEYKEYQRER